MAVTLNASTTAGLVQTADTSGELALQTAGTTAVSISSGQVATFAQAPVLPAASIPQAALAANVAGNGPAFSAYAGATTSVSNNTFTKVLFSVENFDTNNNFASSTFTPTVAGYYQINANISFPVTTGTRIALYKNGAVYVINSADGSSGVLDAQGHTAALIYCNGSTDYIEVYAYSNGNGTTTVSASATATQFSGAMIRSA